MQKLRLLACVVFSLQLAACVTETTVVGSDRQIRPKMDQKEAARTRIALGINYLQRGDNAQAKFNLEKAKTLAPELAEVHNALAYYYQQVAEFEDAENSYKTAIELEPNNADSYNNYGAFLCQRGKYDQAEQLLLQAISRPGYIRAADSYENIALCRLEQKDFIQAKTYLDLSIKHNASRPSALFNLASVNYAMADLPAAQVLLDRMQSASQISPRSVLLGYLIAQEQQDYSRMQTAEQLLLTTYPQSQETLLFSQGKLNQSEFRLLRQDYKQQLLQQPAEQIKAGVVQPKIKITRKKPPAAVAQQSDEAQLSAATVAEPLPEVENLTLTEPAAASAGSDHQPEVTEAAAATEVKQHEVQQDETLYGIAERYSVTISDIISWNSLRDNQPIVKGQVLWIGQQAPRQIEPQIEVPERYQIQYGDTLFRISMRYRVKLTSLLQWNNLTEQSPIRAGQFIYLKDPAQLEL
ncbi:type IV pilus biogenesis/stability protein PilW [Rheinheimera sp. 1928-s]|uniref:type IV pilus biogenesis/stability protein PilW n=1 Tax=Rheinheimera sp. 1928-s TaxID=3033803 RepID=UPI00260276E2|nr:type IV pilus biogenesis/stability protein PilW [Rheinheimera sp. 1928-s]MDF3124504.1 type IV pilus biogenesis/stability protein PilW [Rheinheimera sp. 1928-s]